MYINYDTIVRTQQANRPGVCEGGGCCVSEHNLWQRFPVTDTKNLPAQPTSRRYQNQRHGVTRRGAGPDALYDVCRVLIVNTPRRELSTGGI